MAVKSLSVPSRFSFRAMSRLGVTSSRVWPASSSEEVRMDPSPPSRM